MKEFEVANHEPSLLPDGEWNLVWADEFDGTELDTTKWSYRYHMAGKRHNCWIDNAVSFDGNSNIIFHLVEKDGKYYSSALQTGENYTDKPNGESKNSAPKFMHKYGYYECRCKLQKEFPWWSAFWIQSPNVAILDNPKEAGVEADIMESFSPGNIIPQMNHWSGYGENHKCVNTAGLDHWLSGKDEIPVSLDEYHRFGLKWDETGYTFYVDGKQCGQKITAPVSDAEQFVLLTTECKGERGPIDGYTGPMEFESGITDSFIVDYVRVFDEVR